MESEKRCPNCGEVKPLDGFNRNAGQPDGRQALCRPCHQAKTKAWRAANPERHLDHARADRKRNREKVNARGVTHRAIKRGALARPDACQRCGRADRAIEAHHADYTKPLEVEWLCQPCHTEVHREARSVAA